MVKTIRTFFLSFSILAFLLFSTIGTTTVYADDGTGTETSESATSTEETTPAGDEQQPAGSETEEAPPVDEGQPAEEPAVEEPLEAILEQVPDNTTVTVLSSEGEALPLVSQESADAIATSDPFWCPGVPTDYSAPAPDLPGCTGSFTSFTELLTELQNNPGTYQGAGTIFVQQGTYMGGETSIDFNSYDLSNISNSNLTVQGGWNNTTNTVDTSTTSNFNVPITIGSNGNPWAGSLTINNISIDGVSSQTGLTLYTDQNINLDNVVVTNSQGGADLNAGGNVTVEDSQFNNNQESGASIKADGSVNVKSSGFNNNGSGDVANPVGKGLEVTSGGAVTLASVSANNNQLFGANVNAVGNVTVTNGFFSSNQGYAYVDGWVYEGYGLKVVTTGNILMDGVTANDNYLYGASLQGVMVDVKNSSFSENDSDWHEHAIGSGLTVVSTGNVTLASVTANNNQLFGADIQSTGGAVTVTNSFFNGNQSYTYSCDGEKTYYGYGIRIVTDREMSLVGVEAMDNGLYGAHLEGKDVAVDTANFSDNGSGDALDMTGRGLEVVSQFDVALVDVIANNNQLFGADITAGNLVAVEQSQFNGHIVYYHDYFTGEILHRDGGYGLKVVTLGDIAVEDVSADGNYLYGAYLSGNDVTVEDSSFSSNGSGVISAPPGNGNGYGLMVVGTGEAELIGVTANSNQFFGADVKAKEDVTILKSFFSGNQSVTFTPCLGLTFYGYGLTVVTEDDIFLNFVTANSNNLWGASLKGDDVTVYNSQFNNNISDSNIFIDDTGLIVDAAGDVDIFKTEAKENRLIGAVIKAEGDVYISQSIFTDNRGFTCLYDWCPEGSITYHGYGLQVTTPGLISVTGTNASNNNLFGASLNGAVVTIKDSTFNNNGMGNGLTVTASDNVTLTNVTALNNGGNGVEVTGVCQKIVKVTGGTFSDNLLYGLNVLNATLVLDGTQTFANNGSGNVFNDTSTCVVVVPAVATTLTIESAPVLSPVTISSASEAGASPAFTAGTTSNQPVTEEMAARKTGQKDETRVNTATSNVTKWVDRKGLYKKPWSMFRSCITMM